MSCIPCLYRHRQDILDAEEEKTPHEHIPLGRFNRAHSPRWYAKKIEKLGKEGNVRFTDVATV